MAVAKLLPRTNCYVNQAVSMAIVAGNSISQASYSTNLQHRTGDLFYQTKRSYTKSTAEKRYTLNYHKLKEGGAFGGSKKGAAGILHSTDETPTTVADNVKNVQGWKRGAERGFLGSYTDIIQQVSSSTQFPELSEWYTKVLTQNLSSSVLGKRRFGLLVPITYFQLKESRSGKASREEMKHVHSLGWAVELVRAAQAVTSDTIGLHDTSGHVNHKHTLSQVIRTPVTSAGDPPWAEKHNLGSRAFNDALLLQNGAYELVRHNFKESESYPMLVDAMAEVFRILSIGRAIMLRITDNGASTNVGARLSRIDGNTYKKIIKYTMSHPKYVLPVQLALHAAAVHDKKIHSQADTVLNDIGYLAEITGDFASCFFDQTGRDIQDGRLTWLIVNAYLRANPAQKKALEDNYGAEESGKADIVKQIYDNLNLKKMCGIAIEESRQGLYRYIQQLGENAGLPTQFYLNLLDNIEDMA